MLIWELRPRTVIELGAAAGGSALWLADVMTAFGIGATIKSVDLSISRITVRHPAIEFVRADLSLIPGSGLPLALPSLPHPWLIIGDAHVNLAGVLEYLDQFTTAGDYLIVEDTVWPGKHRELAEFMHDHGSRYLVDTNYTDNFGYNGTWNWNSILRCAGGASGANGTGRLAGGAGEVPRAGSGITQPGFRLAAPLRR